MTDEDKVIEALESVSFDKLDPLPYFKAFAERYPKAIVDDERYYHPVYPDFDDFNYRHDTTTVTPVYLNDFDFNLADDRERLIQLIRSDFDTDTFESIARCQCPIGGLRGNYLLGSDRVCKDCGSKVEKLTESELSTKVWLRLPEGVDTFINPGLFRTYLQKIVTSSPKIEIITYIIDSRYRRQVRAKPSEKIRMLVSELEKLDVELSINGFYRKADVIMEYFLIGNGRYLTSLKNADAEMILQHYYRFKHLMFCKVLPVPNKLNVIVERNGKDRYASTPQLRSNSVYESIADTRDSGPLYRATLDDIRDNIERVGRAISKLAELRANTLKDNQFPKRGVIRKSVCSGSFPLTGRSVITSRTGILDPGFIHVPWKMAIAQLQTFIKSHLYRIGYTPMKAEALLARAANHIVPEIDEFFKYHEDRRNIICKSGRMPSIQYLSRRTFYAKINRDLEDQSIGLPILSVSAFNADFDGKWLPSLNFFNCWKPLKVTLLQVGRELH